jgi:hypothetical protein
MHTRGTNWSSHTTYWLTAGLLLCLGWLAFAPVQAATSDDPPDRVARVGYLKGEVSLKPAGTDDWAPAVLNRPLTTDDQLSLDPDARAELQTGSSVIQLDGGAAFSFSELSDTVLQGRVTDGAIHLTVRRLQEGEVVEIDTPQAAITVTKPGNYRIEVLDNGTHTLVKTYSGECQVAGNNEPARLQTHEQVVLDDSGQPVRDQQEFTSPDEFDRWAQTRSEQLNRSASSQHVAPDVIGYEDLDSHGDWTTAPDYGSIWYPRVAVGWSPYRDGHWAWVSPWGWTWVDNAPWGFAPFHYGRWAYLDSRWGWVPGPVHVHAVYAPALVAWVGGPSFGVSVSFGTNVGWFPLGPREVYVPGYHCGPRYIHNVNYSNTVIVNNTIINRAYVNRSTHIEYQHQSRHNAVTVVSRDTFVSARPVNNHMVHDRDMRGWQARGASPAITPVRSSTLGPRWNGNQAHMPDMDRRVNREVKTHHAPPPQRASFDQEQRAIRDNNNRPIPRGDLWANAHDGSRNNTGRNPGGQDNTSGMHQNGDSRFRDDHPRRAFDRTQEDYRPTTQSPMPSATPRENHQPRPDNQSRPQDRHDQQQSPRERTVFHSNDHLPNQESSRQNDRQYDRQYDRQTNHQIDRQANPQYGQFGQNGRVTGTQPEMRPERNHSEPTAPRTEWPQSNSPRYESRDNERSRTIEHSRPAESPQPQRYEQRHESRPQPQPQQQQQQQPEQRQQTQNQAASERREQPHQWRDHNGRER